jgi:hypothetical protein
MHLTPNPRAGGFVLQNFTAPPAGRAKKTSARARTKNLDLRYLHLRVVVPATKHGMPVRVLPSCACVPPCGIVF